MKGRMVVALGAAIALGGIGVGALAAKPANDVGVKMKVSETGTWGPVARITVKNLGTSTQNGVLVRVWADHEGNGEPIWSDTADLPAKKSVTLTAHVLLDAPTGVLVAEAVLNGASDEDPTDNRARAALNLKGKDAGLYVGRSLFDAFCAKCHETSDSALQGLNTKAMQTAANIYQDETDFSSADAKALLAYLKAPDAVQEPAALPEMPIGGWPTYTDDVKPLWDDRCVKCHGGSQASASVRLDSYEKAFNPARACLSAVASGSMPQGGKKFTSDEVQVVRDWINGGRRQ